MARLGIGVAVTTAALHSACADAGRVEVHGLADRLWSEFCEPRDACGCDLGPDAPCANVGAIEQRVREMLEGGATWDGACMAEHLEHVNSLGCERASTDETVCPRPCSPLHGDLGVGEACERVGDFSLCRAELECRSGQCIDPCAVPGELGRPCRGLPCSTGLACDQTQDQCVPSTSVCGQQPCPIAGHVCDLGVCTDLVADGAACTGHSQCLSEYCPAGFCGALPDVGQRCDLELCVEGARCVEGTCEAVDCGPEQRRQGDECVSYPARVCQVSLSLPSTPFAD